MEAKIKDMSDEFFESLEEFKKSFLSHSNHDETVGYNAGLEVAVFTMQTMREMYKRDDGSPSEEDRMVNVTFNMISDMANSLTELFRSFQINEEEEKKYGKEEE